MYTVYCLCRMSAFLALEFQRQRRSPCHGRPVEFIRHCQNRHIMIVVKNGYMIICVSNLGHRGQCAMVW